MDVGYYGNWPSIVFDEESGYSRIGDADENKNTICCRGVNPKAAWNWEVSNNNSNPLYVYDYGDAYKLCISTHTTLKIGETNYDVSPTNGIENLENIILYDFGLKARAITHQYGVSFKSFKIYDEDTLILDLIPVKNKQTQELGMYDRVKRKFLIDADPEAKGSGFVAGPVIGDLQ